MPGPNSRISKRPVGDELTIVYHYAPAASESEIPAPRRMQTPTGAPLIESGGYGQRVTVGSFENCSLKEQIRVRPKVELQCFCAVLRL
jgi:hypothetical protein